MKTKPCLPLAVTVLAFQMAGAVLAQTPTPPFSAIYAFGDCLSDTHTPPPFLNWSNRWSNGPMWIELLSTNLGLSYVANRNYSVTGSATFDVWGQVVGAGTPNSASNALFTVWAGPVDFYYHLGENDFFGPYTSPTNDLVWNSAITQGTRYLSNMVVRLYSKGARSILLANVDDVSRQPVVIRTHNAQTRGVLRQRVEQFNAAIAAAMAALDASRPDLRLICPDAFGLINGFIDHPADYGMTKTYPAAMQDPALTDRSLNGPGADYVFWDEYGHPTAKGHEWIAALYLEAIQSARPERLSLTHSAGQLGIAMKKLLIGRDYTLQSSTNSINWQDIYPFTALAGTNQWTVAANDPSHGFFRLRWTQ